MSDKPTRKQRLIDKFIGKDDVVIVSSVEAYEESNGIKFTTEERNCLSLINSDDETNMGLGITLAENLRDEVMDCANQLLPSPGIMFWAENGNVMHYNPGDFTMNDFNEMIDKLDDSAAKNADKLSQEVHHTAQEIKARCDENGQPIRPAKPVKLRKKSNHSWYKFKK